jgi:hypothetical protein
MLMELSRAYISPRACWIETEHTSTKTILGRLGEFVSSCDVSSSCGDSCPRKLVLVSGVAYVDASESIGTV